MPVLSFADLSKLFPTASEDIMDHASWQWVDDQIVFDHLDDAAIYFADDENTDDCDGEVSELGHYAFLASLPSFDDDDTDT
jgi:hypothetical protein